MRNFSTRLFIGGRERERKEAESAHSMPLLKCCLTRFVNVIIVVVVLFFDHQLNKGKEEFDFFNNLLKKVFKQNEERERDREHHS
jgi:hypothetical protein